MRLLIVVLVGHVSAATPPPTLDPCSDAEVCAAALASLSGNVEAFCLYNANRFICPATCPQFCASAPTSAPTVFTPATHVNCDDAVTLPQYTATPEYLLLYIDTLPRPFIILSSSNTVDRNTNSFNETSGHVHHNGITGESWSFSVTTQIVSSYNERTSPPTLLETTYVVVSGRVGRVSFRSVHYLAANISFCAVYGARLVENAPIVGDPAKNAPHDVLLQAPLAVAVVSRGSVLLDVLCPVVHDAASGSVSYSSVDGRLTTLLQSHSYNGLVNSQMGFIRVNNVTRVFSDNTHTPLMGVVPGGGPTMPFYPVAQLESSVGPWCGPSCISATSGLHTATYDIGLRHLNLMPFLLRSSLTVPVNSTLSVIPIHAGSPTSRGLLDSTVCEFSPRFNFSAPARSLPLGSSCDTIVLDPFDGSSFYCAENYDGGRVLKAGAVSAVCDGHAEVQLVGLCGVAAICVESRRVSIQDVGAHLSSFNWTLSETVVSINVVPADMTTGGCTQGWNAFVTVSGGGTHTVYLYNSSAGTRTAVETRIGSVFMFSASHNLYSDVVYAAGTDPVPT
jgi:hypothetical protein